MNEPLDPDEYAAALDRFLDGLEADAPADAQVRADTDAIAKALGLIGGALAAEGSGATAAAGAVPPVAAGGATVVQMSSWRSKLNPRVLAAAASLIVVVGIGIPLTMNSTGSNNDESATAAGDPAAVADAAGAPVAPESAKTMAGNDAFAGPTDTSAGALATDTGTTAGSATGAVPGAATVPGSGQAADQQALEDSRDAAAPAPATGSAGKAASDGDAAFAADVACARAIFVGSITGVKPTADGAHYSVTFLITEWIAPASGPVTATYDVYGSTVNSPGADETFQAGQRRLFVVPASAEERMYAYRQKDWPETRKQIKAVRDERAGQGC